MRISAGAGIVPSSMFDCAPHSAGHRPLVGRLDPRTAFSLIELLAVMGCMSLLLAVVMPAVNTLKGGADFTQSTDNLALTLDRARNYAISKNTYVWVGFYEESATATAPSNTPPPYSGTGRVVLAIVASVDGTPIFDANADAGMLPAERLVALERIQKISGIHLADVGAPIGNADGRHLDGRPGAPYTDEDAPSTRLSSADSQTTPFPFQIAGYHFYKTIRFSPSGEAAVNGSLIPKRVIEIGMRPTQGDQVIDSRNLAAVQFSGLGGNVRVYRR